MYVHVTKWWNGGRHLYEKEMDMCFRAHYLIQYCFKTALAIWVPKNSCPKNNFCLSKFQISSLKHVLESYDNCYATNKPA